jgi:uncharacterized membrane protein YgdD (TMEM256/DUF423 family)
MNRGRTFLIAGTVLAGLAVAAGAFGSHGLRAMVAPERLVTFETAVRYQMYHALGLLLVGLLAVHVPRVRTAGRLFLAGTAVFSGSLYLLVLTGAGWLGAVTPLGGVAFIAGWAHLAMVLAQDWRKAGERG